MSNEIDLLWYFTKTQSTTDGNPSVDKFKDYSPSESFVRELAQNALDQHYDKTKPVTLSVDYTPDLIKKNEPTTKRNWDKLTNDLKNVLEHEQFGRDLSELKDRALVVRETNTTGLIGKIKFFRNPDEESDNDHYSNFMFRDDWATKSTGGGSTGNGKAAYCQFSNSSSCILVTNRSDDNRILATGFVKLPNRAVINGEYKDPNAYLVEEDDLVNLDNKWNNDEKDEVLKPIENESKITNLLKFFHQDINAVKKDFGVTWIIPSPLQMVKQKGKSIDLKNINQIKKEMLQSSFLPIFTKKLVLKFNKEKDVIDHSNVLKTCKKLFPERKEFFEFINIVANFDKDKLINIKDDWKHTDHNLDDLDKYVEEQDRVKIDNARDPNTNITLGFKFPYILKNKDGQTLEGHATIFRKSLDRNIKPEGIVARDYLIISQENAQEGRSFTFVMIEKDNNPLYDLVRDTEPADHRRFRTRSDKLEKNWVSGDNVIRKFRKSLQQLSSIFISAKADDLAIYFAELFGFSKSEEIAPPPTPAPTPAPEDEDDTDEDDNEYDEYDEDDEDGKNFIETNISGGPNDWTIKISQGPNKLKQSDLPKILELNLVSKGHNDFPSNLDESEPGFSSSTLSSLSKNIQILKQENETLQIEVTDSDFNIEINNIDVHHPAGVKIKL
tara:strand:- start:2496 stop:4499 length:2004 start_codon:yes stop_codon:yes gene_type:complete